MKIGSFDLDENILVIAEIGNNHEGDFSLAERMIVEAARTGAGAVKFQTIVPERLVAPDTPAFDLFTKFQFSQEQFRKLKQVADSEGVMFLSTPFDIESAQFLDELVPAFKIASGDNNFWPLMEAVCQTGKPIILSTGMAGYPEIRRAKQFIEDVWSREEIEQELIVLHCVSQYPTPPEDANLLSIPFLKEKLGGVIGFSDHTIGIVATLFAVTLGARVIEKHFTLDKNYSDFPDHPISMDPDDLRQLMERIPEVQSLLGNYGAFSGKNEQGTASAARRSIVANQDLKAGDVIHWDLIDWVRPGNGLPPGEEWRVLGKTLNCSLAKGQALLPEYFSD